LYSLREIENFDIDAIWELYRNHVNPAQVELIGMFPFGRQLVSHAEGCWIYLKDGTKVLDLTGGIGVLNHGHNHPKIIQARNEFSSKKRMEVHKNFFSPYIAGLSANLAELIPELPYSYFGNSGAEAVEGALKIAFKFFGGERKFILHSDISFHGKLLGAGGLTGSPEINFSFPTIPGIEKFKFNDIASVVTQINSLRKTNGKSDIYAIIVEPLNASTMRSCSPDFLMDLRKICDAEDILLIFDEVYTGWGKTGYLFNYKRVDGLTPDILSYAKSFGGGKASISGFSYTEKVARTYQNLRDATLHSTTYYGFGEECATAIEAIRIIVDEGLVQNASSLGQIAEKRFLEISNECDYIGEVRGSGALWGLLPKPGILGDINRLIYKFFPKKYILSDLRLVSKIISGAIVNHLYSKHLVLSYFGVNIENPVIISFPLISDELILEYALQAVEETLSCSLNSLVSEFLESRAVRPRAEVD